MALQAQVSEILPQDGSFQSAPSDAGATAAAAASRTFNVVVHIMGDYAFKKYLQHCTVSDLLLFRGLLLKVHAAA